MRVRVCVKKRTLFFFFSLSIYVYLRSGNSCNKISALISNTKHSHTTCRELSTTQSRQTETSKCTMCARGEDQTLVIIAILFWRSSVNVSFLCLFSSNWVALHLITCWLARYLVYSFLFTRLIRLLVSIQAQYKWVIHTIFSIALKLAPNAIKLLVFVFVSFCKTE